MPSCINYRYVVDNYPDSKYYLQARFAPIWLTEMYESPGDSSVIMAYDLVNRDVRKSGGFVRHYGLQ